MARTWDDLDQLFATIDAEPANTILIFDDVEIANRYAWHCQAYRRCVGCLVRVEDTRTGSGLLTQWRDPWPADEEPRRQREALWLLEEDRAGRRCRPRGHRARLAAAAAASPGVQPSCWASGRTRRRASQDQGAGMSNKPRANRILCRIALHMWRHEDEDRRICTVCGRTEIMVDTGGGVAGPLWDVDPPRPPTRGYWIAAIAFAAAASAILLAAIR